MKKKKSATLVPFVETPLGKALKLKDNNPRKPLATQGKAKPLSKLVQQLAEFRYVPESEIKEKTIHVTKKDIKSARNCRGNAMYCPIARAAIRAFASNDIGVGLSSLHVNSRSYQLPDKAKKFVFAFDAGHPVKPFGFKVLVA